MKTFTTYDVSFRGKRSRMSLSDTRVLTMKKKLDIVEEVSKAGGSIIDPNNITSQAELEELFKLALKGFNISLTTPKGCDRDIFRLKWRTFAKFNLNLNSNEEGKTKEQEGGITTKLPAPAPAPAPAPVQQGGHDNWLYEHGDGVKRKVPSTWTFPMASLEDVNILWNCNNEQQKIMLMKTFDAVDVSFLHRGNKCLRELRGLMTSILTGKLQGKDIQ